MAALDQGIRILVIEDNPGDFVLINEYLLDEAEQPDIVHAKTLADTEKLLERQGPFDAVILDLTLPDASGEDLVKRVSERTGEVPVIVLTGYENREFGLKTLGMGVSDYLLKDELNPFLLSKSISYSIERSRINRSLRRSEQQYRDLFNLSPLPKWVYDVETLKILDVNQTALDHYGYSRDEFLSMTIEDLRPEEDIPELEKVLEKSLYKEGIYHSGVFRHLKHNGEVILVDIQSTKINYNGRTAKMVVADDVTEQKENEKALKSANEKLKTAQQIARLGYWQFNAATGELYWSDEVYNIWGRDRQNFEPTLDHLFETIHPEDVERYKAYLKESQDGIAGGEIEYRILLPDDTVRWVVEKGDFQATRNKNKKLVEGTVQDITEKIEREKKLQESVERYEYVTRATDEIIYDWDIELNHLDWDVSFKNKFHYDDSAGRYTIEYWGENVHPEDIEDTRSSLYGTLADPERSKWEAEYRFQKRDGSYATVFERGFILRDESGSAIRMIGSLQDITSRKEYEEKLEELSLVASKTTDIIIMTGPNDKIRWVNGAFEQHTGYSYDEVVGENPGELLQGPDSDPETIKRISRAVRNRESIQEVLLNYTKSGEKYWLDLTINPIFDDEGECTGFIAIEKDVTEQIQREKELQESVERYEIVAKATSDTIWDLDLENDVNRYNSNIYHMFGYQKHEVQEPAQWWRDKLHPEDRPRIMAEIEEALDSNTDRFQLEYRFKAADGSYKNIYDRAFIVTNGQGEPTRIIGAMQDITQQKEEEQWLKLFESAVATTNESVAIIEASPTDLPGRKILYVNKAFEEMTGYHLEEVIGETLHILNGPKTSSVKREQLKDAMEKWESCQAEFINYRKSGEEFWINVSMAPVQDSKGEYSHWVCVGRDVTNRREREKALKESLKEKETLLSEIHHRVKNNLAVVSGMIQLQAMDEEDEGMKQKLLDSIVRIQTMGSIHELLYKSDNFSRLEVDKNIEKLVSNITETFQISNDLSIEFNLEKINLNINQAIPCSLIINEVVTNILKHAFPDRKAGTMGVDISEEDGTIHLEIRDNGRGLPENFQELPKHNSLGLQLIQTLADQLEAEYAYRDLDQGAAFTLKFKKADVKGIGSAYLQ